MHATHWLLHFPTLDVDLLARIQDILRKGERVKNQAQTRKGGGVNKKGQFGHQSFGTKFDPGLKFQA